MRWTPLCPTAKVNLTGVEPRLGMPFERPLMHCIPGRFEFTVTARTTPPPESQHEVGTCELRTAGDELDSTTAKPGSDENHAPNENIEEVRAAGICAARDEGRGQNSSPDIPRPQRSDRSLPSTVPTRVGRLRLLSRWLGALATTISLGRLTGLSAATYWLATRPLLVATTLLAGIAWLLNLFAKPARLQQARQQKDSVRDCFSPSRASRYAK